MRQDFGWQFEPDRKIAMLVDADNVSHASISAILLELSKHGTVDIRRAYADWTNAGCKGWKDKLHEFAVRPVQQFAYSIGKNATDIALVIDAMELLHTQQPGAFGIASSDADFTPLVMHLRGYGHDVHGFGESKTPIPFVNACTTFHYLDVAAASVTALTDGRGKASIISSTATAAPPLIDPGIGVRRPLSQDAALVTILRGAVEASSKDDGWAAMSTAGSAAARRSINPRDYGVRNFPMLFAATGLFDIHKLENGQGYVADRRNRDRAIRPVR